MTPTNAELLRALNVLRDDALARGMLDVAVAYGWSVIRIGFEQIDAQMADFGRRNY